jgi:hypothetical protein
VVGTAIVLAGAAVVATSAAAPVRKAPPPRIVAAVMLDADRDARADGVRLTYSLGVRHSADRDGRYPFAVGGYGIRSVSGASGKSLSIRLVERSKPDPAARPAVRYRRTASKPVFARSGAQAATQLFRATRPHRRTPPPVTTVAPTTTTTTTTTSTSSPTPLDADGDGHPDAKDCSPRDAKIHPGAADVPDLAFVDSNCDGIDGTEKDAIFVSPLGNDVNPGTKQKPKRQIQAAVATLAAGNGRYVLAAAGAYNRVVAVSGMHTYGGYDPGSWSRGNDRVTSIVGPSEGIEADGARDILLQLLAVRGTVLDLGDNAYGIRAINSSSLLLQRVTVTAGNGQPGAAGVNGDGGRSASPGQKGANGACDHGVKAPGGAGGDSVVGRIGGKGGDGHYESRGSDGAPGIAGTPGGKGGPATPGSPDGTRHGQKGGNGSNGAPGPAGPGGTNGTSRAVSTGWQGRGGVDGVYGAPGNGGGGGGAGGGQDGFFEINGTGNGGGGGGGGGEGGRGGTGGRPGGGSFGVWLSNSVLVAEESTITSGNGGAGGRGGNGGPGGPGGAGGPSNGYCYSELGEGGAGGRGGDGGQGGGGGGGAGGPSIGIFKLGGAQTKLTLSGTKVVAGMPGAGGATGAGGTLAARAEAGIAAAVYSS